MRASHRRRQVGCRVHARWRAVVLVEHNAVESQLVGVHAFIEIALEKVVGRGRIEPRIGKRQAQRRILVALFIGIFVVRKLGEVITLHGIVASGGMVKVSVANDSTAKAGPLR